MLRPLHLAALALAAAIALPATAPLAAAPAAPAAAQAQGQAQLKVRFTGLHPATGYILAGVYASEDSFNAKTAPVQGARIAVTGDTVETQFTLPPGRYAIKVFQDVDSDGKMGLNPFGIPTEPYGASNNAVGHMGPPAWADASFDVAPGGSTTQTIALH